MFVNVSRLELSASPKFLELRIANDAMPDPSEGRYPNEYITPYLSRSELPLAIECSLGQSEFYPWFDDIGYHVRFTPSGINVWKKDGYHLREYYFTLPGSFVANLLSMAYHGMDTLDDDNERWRYTVSQEKLKELRQEYAPRYQFEYTPYGGHYDPSSHRWVESNEGMSYKNVKTQIARDLCNPLQTGLQRALDGFRQIAKNYSDGIPSIIRLSFDNHFRPDDMGTPQSYIWRILAWDTRKNDYNTVIWGGLIAHPVRSKDPNYAGLDWYKRPIVGYEYSTHT